jgi:hypothetical protein
MWIAAASPQPARITTGRILLEEGVGVQFRHRFRLRFRLRVRLKFRLRFRLFAEGCLAAAVATASKTMSKLVVEHRQQNLE